MWIILTAAAIALAVMLAFALGRRHARRLQRETGVRIERYKMKRRHDEIALEVFGSREVVEAIKGYARNRRIAIAEAERQARSYLDEILPRFNLLAYYRVATPLSAAVLKTLYRIVVEKGALQYYGDRVPKGTTVVWVLNHRSDLDPFLVTYALSRYVSVSYAVGEWAQFWPLNQLFRLCGAYFIRRRYRETLYHAILKVFVQTITRNGVTQAFFIEGGLSRDGAFQKPKLGMLDYLVSSKRSPGFTTPLFLVPAAVNFDRVLEDRALTSELLGVADRPSVARKLWTTIAFTAKNLGRLLTGRLRRYGSAAVSFGEPILVDQYIAEHQGILSPDYEERKPDLEGLADLIMTRISGCMPVTPVPLVASIFAEAGGAMTEEEMLAAIARKREELAKRVWAVENVRTLESPATDIWRAAQKVLRLRRLIVENEGRWSWNPEDIVLRDYYANSLLEWSAVRARGWPAREKVEKADGVVPVRAT